MWTTCMSSTGNILLHFLILRLPCMSGVILCFVRLQSRLTGILLTKHFTLENPLWHVSCSVPLWPNTLHHILSSASTFYCRACLLQCLSTKARSQTWQNISYLFQTLEVLRVKINLTRICLLNDVWVTSDHDQDNAEPETSSKSWQNQGNATVKPQLTVTPVQTLYLMQNKYNVLANTRKLQCDHFFPTHRICH
jgi:hypothetical protein